MSEILPSYLESIKKNGYTIFTSGNFNLNIFGIRNSTNKSDVFDDMIGVCYKENNVWKTKLWKVTTDPGAYYLANKAHWLNSKGVAILAPGQYRSSYKVGLHRGKYEALIQYKTVKVYRDTDLDSELDFNPGSLESGLFGINIHASSSTPFTGTDEDNTAKSVSAWSAGCNVFARDKDFKEFMALVKKSAGIYGNSFTYTLLRQDQL